MSGSSSSEAVTQDVLWDSWHNVHTVHSDADEPAVLAIGVGADVD